MDSLRVLILLSLQPLAFGGTKTPLTPSDEDVGKSWPSEPTLLLAHLCRVAPSTLTPVCTDPRAADISHRTEGGTWVVAKWGRCWVSLPVTDTGVDGPFITPKALQGRPSKTDATMRPFCFASLDLAIAV
jgi:hypothetical protein